MKIFLPLLLASCAIAAPAQADDWLAALPECAAPPGSTSVRAPGPAIVYPRPGLPAVVAAGQRLVARVQLPLPLTPPPGIQQERALREYSAELRAPTPAFAPGAATAAPADAPAMHLYPMEVIGVRPDGASSLRYRVTIPVPAWVAPGTYGLRLIAAGVVLHGDAPVVVLAQDAEPRLRALDADGAAQDDATRLPPGVRAAVDVWVRAEASAYGASTLEREAPSTERVDAYTYLGAPVLEPQGLVAALRVANGLWVLGDCAGPHLPFADEVRSLLRVERRTRLAHPALAAPTTAQAALDEAPQPLLQLQASAGADGGTAIRARASQPLELSFVVRADGRPLSASASTLELYPATELPAKGAVPNLIARWLLPASVEGELAQAPRKLAVPRLPIELQPSPVPSGHLLRVSVRGQPGAERPPLLALRFDERSTAFGSGEASHRFTALGPARMRALVILADGTAASSTPSVEVVTESAVGCSTGGGPPTDPTTFGLALGLWAAPRLLKRRPRRGAGNRLGARSGSWDQPRTRCANPGPP